MTTSVLFAAVRISGKGDVLISLLLIFIQHREDYSEASIESR